MELRLINEGRLEPKGFNPCFNGFMDKWGFSLAVVIFIPGFQPLF